MNDFYIGFSKPKGMKFPIYANLIRIIYKTEYSHVYVRFYASKYDRWLVYESVGKGTRFVEYNNWQNHAQVIDEFIVDVTDEQKKIIITSCIDNLGKDYGILQAIGIGLKKLVKKWFNVKVNNPFPDPSKEICSDAVSVFINALSGHKVINSEEVSPSDIYEFLVDNNYKRV